MYDENWTAELPCQGCPIGGGVPPDRLQWLEFHIPRAADLLCEVAAATGQALNASATGRRLGISCRAVSRRIATLEKAGVVRILPSLANRHSHVLLRDCRLLQKLGGSRRALLLTCLTEHVARAYTTRAPSTRYFHWAVGRVKQIDLVVPTGPETIGFCFKECLIARRRDWAPLRRGLERGVIHRGFVVYPWTNQFVTARVVLALPIQVFLRRLGEWLACRSFVEARQFMRSLSASQVPGESRHVPDVGKLGPTAFACRGLAGETDAQAVEGAQREVADKAPVRPVQGIVERGGGLALGNAEPGRCAGNDN